MLVLFGVGPLDVLVKVDPGDGDPFVEAFVEVVEIAVELPPTLGLLDAEDLGATGLAIFDDLGDAADSGDKLEIDQRSKEGVGETHWRESGVALPFCRGPSEPTVASAEGLMVDPAMLGGDGEKCAMDGK